MAYVGLVLAGYLLGGIPVGLVVGKRVRGIDIRQYGSGMVGATNTLRTLGWGPSAVVFLADVGKALAAVLLARLAGAPEWIQALAGVAAVLGHCWSVYIGFGGGRGVACTFGATLALSPIAALVGLLFALGTIAKSRYVSLGSLVGTTAGTLAILGLIATGRAPAGAALMVVATAIVFYRHRDNVERLRAGTERKLGEKAMPATPAAEAEGNPRAGSAA